jgi:hypothetical protein
MGVDRPLPPYINRHPRIHSICTHLEAPEGIASVELLGLKCASSLWFRKTDGCPALTGRERNILSIMLFALDEMVTVMGPDSALQGSRVCRCLRRRGAEMLVWRFT